MKKLPSVMRIQFFFQFLLLMSLFGLTPVKASEQNKLAQQRVIDAAEQFVYNKLSRFDSEDLQVQAMPIDERIRIPHCAAPFRISASEEALQQSNVTVKASCPVSDWYLYLVVKAKQMQPVVVLSTMVSPGTVLTPSNLQVIKVDKKQLRTTTFADIDSVVGARMKRRTRAGYPISPSQLCFVCKGDKVVITASTSGFELKTNGIAEQDGVVGDTITVVNSRSKKRVHARVISTNEVEVAI